MHPLLLTAIVAAATWDAWRWYALRIASALEEGAALALTIVFLGVVGTMRRSPVEAPYRLPLIAMAFLLAAYAAAFAFLPPIVRAAIAIATTLACLYVACFRERPPIALWGLVALALPVLPSLQFTLGYPMRIVSAALSVALLQSHGLAIARDGTFLLWRGETIQFDAPCSGINMLWAGFLLTLMGCVLLRLAPVKVAIALVASLVLAIIGNVLRASSLFYIEAGMIRHAPAWWHESIGLVAFALSAAATLWLLTRLHGAKVPA